MRSLAAVFLTLAVLPGAFGREGGRKAGSPAHGLNFYSVERELALGRQLSAELERQVKFVDDPILSEYVNRLAQNLVRHSDVTIPVSVRILEAGDRNAFTLPGGHIYLDSSTLTLTESEAELAFVLAHELGHVAARHATREASRDQLVQLGTVPLLIFGGWSGAAVRQLAQSGAHLGLLKGSRSFEAEADRLGVDFLDNTGYDPGAAIDVFERIEVSERKAPGRVRRLYTTHPVTASRIELTQKHVAHLPSRPEYVINTSEYETMRVRAVAAEMKRMAQSQNQHTPRLIKTNPE